jgi:DNA-directed RNA polymerase specialized sigma24 family protein
MWLTLRRSAAENLVLETMAQAYRSWQNPTETIGSKARLFRTLTRERFGAMAPRYRIEPMTHCQWRAAVGLVDNRTTKAPMAVAADDMVVLSSLSDVTVKGAVARLKVRPRLILLLLMREEFSYADIAYITDIRETTVRTLLSRLRHRIPHYLARLAEIPIDADGCSELTPGSVRNENESEAILRSTAPEWRLQQDRKFGQE